MPIRVSVGNRTVEFPDGTSEQEMRAALEQLPSEPAVSHDNRVRPIATGGGRGTGLDVRKSTQWARDNAPTIGAALATTATGGGVLPLIAAAGAGGAAGSALRGDDASTIATEGATQAAIQGGFTALRPIASWVGRGLMKGTVPKNIAKDYQGQVDIPKEMLERGVFPGVPQSAARVARQSSAANAELRAAADTVPVMPRRKIIDGLRPLYREAVTAKEPEIAADMMKYMKTKWRDIGPEGLSGAGQLARKTVKQRQGSAALHAGSAKEAAVIPQAADAERAAIAAHMRETGRAATALDESQALKAIDEVMKDAALGNPITRMRIGGPTAVALTPAGLGATAHAVDKAGQALTPDTVRALMTLFNQRSPEE